MAEHVAAARQLLGPGGMTEQRSCFSHRDAIQQWATVRGHGESAERILRITDRWSPQREVVDLKLDATTTDETGAQRPLALPRHGDELRYSTRTLIATEEALLLLATGDSRRLAEVEAGGAFRAISERFGAFSLSENRRQVDPVEIRALARLREGDPGPTCASSTSAAG